MTFEFAARVGARGFDVELSIAAGETVAVLGPNGAGKSTFLNLVAGLLRPDSGRAVLNDTVLFDIGAAGGRRTGVDDGAGRGAGGVTARRARGGRGPCLPPHRRGVSMLAQDALLFPHLSALDNVAFGPRSAGMPRAEADARAAAWLDRVDAGDLARRKPAQLSGGQAQRIAVARALASDPALLLLDEPMAALDVSVAPALRRMLRDVLADRTAIIVTHDVLDAFTLADRVVVLEAGRIVDIGPTRLVLDRPTTPFAAGLAALNLLTGTASGADVVQTDGGHRLSVRFVEPVDAGARVGVSVRPSLVGVSVTTPAAPDPVPAPGRNVVAGTVTDLEPRGDMIRVRSNDLSADVPPGTVAELDLTPGAEAWFDFAAEHAVAYPL